MNPLGLSFLEKANLLGPISGVLDNVDDNDVVVGLVKCAVIKFFGNLGENKVVLNISVRCSSIIYVSIFDRQFNLNQCQTSITF